MPTQTRPTGWTSPSAPELVDGAPPALDERMQALEDAADAADAAMVAPSVHGTRPWAYWRNT